jgi:hypothetical protein
MIGQQHNLWLLLQDFLLDVLLGSVDVLRGAKRDHPIVKLGKDSLDVTRTHAPQVAQPPELNDVVLPSDLTELREVVSRVVIHRFTRAVSIHLLFVLVSVQALADRGIDLRRECVV